MTPYQLLVSTVDAAKIHEERLRNALIRLQNVLPMDDEKLRNLNHDDYA